jgi:hypothetical protein
VVIGGGYLITGPLLWPTKMQPLLERTPNAFQVEFFNAGSHHIEVGIAYALCAAP